MEFLDLNIMEENILLLGASGSIGNQTLDVMKKDSRFHLVGFSLGHRIQQIPTILEIYKEVKYICVQEKEDYECLKKQYPTITFFYGDQGLLDIIDASNPTLVVNALVGFCGFLPTYHALKNKISVALANKESLVVGGEILDSVKKETGATIYPIDSEHVAISKCLKGNKKEVHRIILTASGGSFRNLKREELENVTVEQALHHPSWQMGKKITIDSATMMNKGFELIEAHYLFHMPMEKIDILLHDESKVHSLIECKDGSYLCDVGPSDMRIPIAYALYKCKRKAIKASKLPLEEFGTFHFHSFDEKRFPCVTYARNAMKEGGTMLACLNAANEEAVYAFLDHKIPFLGIERIIETCMKRHRVIENPTVEDIVYADQITRKEADLLIKEMTK